MHLSDVVSKRRSVYQMLPALNLSLRPAINNDISNPWRKSAYEMTLKENRKLADIARKENEKLAENIDTLKQQLANNTLELQRLQMQIENDMGEERAAEKKELEREIAELKKTIKEENNVHDLRKTLDTLNQQLETQVAELNKLRDAAVVNPVVTEPSAVANIQDAMKELIKTVHALNTQCQKKLNSGLRKDLDDEVKQAQSANQTTLKQRPTSPPPTGRLQQIPEEETTNPNPNPNQTKNFPALERAKMERAKRANKTSRKQQPTSPPTVPPGETGWIRPKPEGNARGSEETSRNRGGGALDALRRTKTEPENPR